MSIRCFFKQLEIPHQKYNLDIGIGTRTYQTGNIQKGVEKILIKDKPDIVLVQGDTNSVLAGVTLHDKNYAIRDIRSKFLYSGRC